MKKITIIGLTMALALPLLSLTAVADDGEKGAAPTEVNDAKAEKEARQAAEEAEKQALKEAKAARKQAEKEAEAAREQAEKEAKAAAKAEKKARKQAEKDAKEAAKAEEKARKKAEKAAKKAAKEAAKREKREAKRAAREARRAARANKIPKAERRLLTQQVRIENQVAELNALAAKPELREDILGSIWREHQISAKRFNKQLEENPELGVGGILVANLISRHAQKGLDKILTAGKEGENWGQVARRYEVNLVQLINDTYRVGITARTLDSIESGTLPQTPAEEEVEAAAGT